MPISILTKPKKWLHKQLSGQVLSSDNIERLIDMGTSEVVENKQAVFKNKQDIRFMEEIKQAYEHVFSSADNIREEHRCLPDTLNVSHAKSTWLLFFEEDVGCLEQTLSRSTLTYPVSGHSKSADTSINATLTDSLLSEGAEYIAKREENYWKRDGRDPFDQIHKPQYYIIVTINHRCNVLRTATKDNTLVNEYACLKQFISALTLLVGRYLPCRQQQEPFHDYLAQAHEMVDTMEQRATCYLHQTSIQHELSQLTNLLETYQGGLMLYLGYCLSNSSLGRNLSVNKLEHAQASLPNVFVNSLLYKNLHAILHHQDEVTELTDVNSGGISELMVRLSQSSTERVHLVMQAYNLLINVLIELTQLPLLLKSLCKNLDLLGTYHIIHNPTLYATLTTNLALIEQLITQTQHNMSVINSENQQLLRGGNANYTRPAQLNTAIAQAKSETLRFTRDYIMEGISHAREKISVVKRLNHSALANERTKLIKTTENALTRMGKQGIIAKDVADNLWRELQAARITRSQKNKKKKKKDASSTENIKSIENIKNNTISDNHKENTMPETQHTVGTLTQSISPEIYGLLFSNQPAMIRFEELMADYDKEIETGLLPAIKQLETIASLQAELNRELTAVKLLNAMTKTDPFIEVDRYFQQLTATIKATTYGGVCFETFEMLQNLITSLYKHNIQPLRAATDELLRAALTVNNGAPLPPNEAVEQLNMLDIPILEYFGEKTSLVANRIRTTLKTLEKQPFDLKTNVLAHYRASIDEQKTRLLPEAKQPQLPDTSTVATQQLPQIIQHNVEQPAPTPTVPPDNEILEAMMIGLLDDVPTTIFTKQEQETLHAFNEHWIALFSDGIGQQRLTEHLENFYRHLQQMNYHETLRYGGGEKIPVSAKDDTDLGDTASNNTSSCYGLFGCFAYRKAPYKKVPKHIKQMLDTLEHGISNIRSLDDARALRNSLIDIAEHAQEYPANGVNWLRYTLFQVRHRVHERLYWSMTITRRPDPDFSELQPLRQSSSLM